MRKERQNGGRAVPGVLTAAVLLAAVFLLRGVLSGSGRGMEPRAHRAEDEDAEEFGNASSFLYETRPFAERAAHGKGTPGVLAALGTEELLPFENLGERAACLLASEGSVRTLPSGDREVSMDRFTVSVCSAETFAEVQRFELAEILSGELKEWMITDHRLQSAVTSEGVFIGVNLKKREGSNVIPGPREEKQVWIDAGTGEVLQAVPGQKLPGDGTGEKLAVTRGTDLLAANGYDMLEVREYGDLREGTFVKAALSELPEDAPVRRLLPEAALLPACPEETCAGFWFPEGIDDALLWYLFCPGLQFDAVLTGEEECGWILRGGERVPVTADMVRAAKRRYEEYQ